MRLRRFVVTLAAVLAAIGGTAPAWAQGTYPSAPVRLVVPYAPGGPTDLVARLVGQKLAESLGQPFVVDHRTGAGGNIGAEHVARAAPDGHTLLVITAAHTINMTLYANVTYDSVRDFAPVALLVRAPMILVTNPSVQAQSVADMLAMARARPGEVSFSSASIGASPHLAMELLQHMAGVKLLHVPYRGSAPAMNALVAGDVSFMLDSMLTGLQMARGGRVRALAVSSARRSELAPEIPTIAETPGLAGFETYTWYGVAAPARTPEPIVRRLNAEINKALRLPDVRRRLLEQGVEPGDTTPEEFGAFIRAEVAKWSEVVRTSGARVE
ncbi:MAG: tripartite tricarboxylate transporter substrate binding protein [Acetobacteraceae bacterium]|nr:tripartite tricarboxylate transporter substrate binding protein [Acetobacteraceae bacterium]